MSKHIVDGLSGPCFCILSISLGGVAGPPHGRFHRELAFQQK
jgi:hypothetical protein